jgi:AraC family transcriptional regulator of adaptative response / DNA-3-methyladenine glycosylase II
LELSHRICDRARRSRDARFDGRFFIAVTSTGVYCRPICPARAPKDQHIRYFPTAAAAEASGFRPCLRCRPEASPGTPAWLGTSGVVSRALRLIGEGALDADGVDRLADRLGITARHLRRLFVQHLGATPLEVAHTRRVHFAKKLLDETTLAFHQVAFASGFGSVRRFNGQMRRTYARTPTELRRLARQHVAAGPGCYRFRLAYRPPYDWEAVMAFLRARATPGVEVVEPSGYRRTISIDGAHGAIDVSRAETGAALCLKVRFPHPQALLSIVERVRRIFDLGADPSVIAEHLGNDRLLRRPLARHRGIRMPGAWDGFELAVRAILGQQISVRAATTLAGRVAAMFGAPVADLPTPVCALEERATPGRSLVAAANGEPAPARLFPTPARLADAPIERAGVMPARAEAIRSLSRRVAGGSITFAPCIDGRSAIAALSALPGIGGWTAEYIAMRALGEPDAFPHGDLVLRRLAGGLTPRELDRRSQTWRPWRAYAVMLLWQSAVDGDEQAGRMRHGHAAKGSTLHAGDHRRARLVAADGAR